jgi:hypothetical protein
MIRSLVIYFGIAIVGVSTNERAEGTETCHAETCPYIEGLYVHNAFEQTLTPFVAHQHTCLDMVHQLGLLHTASNVVKVIDPIDQCSPQANAWLFPLLLEQAHSVSLEPARRV